MNALSSPIFFIILMILGGGVSAYLADLLGFKIGKKRISVLRLRPKHVAQISVTVAGCLIPLVTILLMSASSSEFRAWLTRGREAIQELQQTVQERDRVQDELVQNRTKLAGMQNQFTLQSRLYRTKVDEIAKQDRKLQAQIARVKEQQSKVDRLNRLLQTTERSNIATRKDLEKQKGLLVKEQNNLVRLREQGLQLEKQKKVAEVDLENARVEGQDIKQRNLQLDNENQQLSKKLLATQEQLTALTRDVERFRSERDKALTQSEEAQQLLADLKKNIDDLKTERDRYEAANLILRRALDNYRQTPLTYVALEEVTRIMVASRLSKEEAQVLVTGLLRQARVAAQKKGAKGIDPKQPDDSVRIAYVQGRQGAVTVSSPEQLLPLFTNQPQASVVVASAAFNFFQGEPVVLILSQYSNPVVFQPGEVMVESRIDGRRPEAVIYSQVTEFLVSKVNERARKARMIPVREGYEDSFGRMGPDELLAIVREIQEAGRIVRLQAVIDQETRAGDRLKITLRIK